MIKSVIMKKIWDRERERESMWQKNKNMYRVREFGLIVCA